MVLVMEEIPVKMLLSSVQSSPRLHRSPTCHHEALNKTELHGSQRLGERRFSLHLRKENDVHVGGGGCVCCVF